MIFTIQEGVSAIAGDIGLRTGVFFECLSAVFDVHEGSASTTETAGTGNSPPECQFEVRVTERRI